MGDRREKRHFTAEQKLEIVLAGIKSGNVAEVCRAHDISNTLFYQWRDRLMEGGLERLAGKAERDGQRELKSKIAKLERALGRKTYELDLAGNLLRDWE
ncbi:MAG: transposase [Actinomycetota bacterium]